MFERVMIGLFAGAVASLGVVACIGFLLGSDFDLLTLNAGPGPWVWLGSWLVLALSIALPRRPAAAGRLGAGVCALVLLVAALLGFARGTPLAAPVGVCLVLLASGCVGLGLASSEGGTLAARSRRATDGQLSRPRRPRDGGGVSAEQARSHRVARAGAWLGWAVCGLSFCLFLGQAFRAEGVARDAGHAGMLVAFFLMLPGMSLRAWFPRVAAALWWLAAAAIGLLAVRAQQPSWLGLALVTAASGVVLAARRVFAAEAAPSLAGESSP